jgi:hypothetical protein
MMSLLQLWKFAVPLAITRQKVYQDYSITLSEAENQAVRSHPQRRDLGHDDAVAWSKGRDSMQVRSLTGYNACLSPEDAFPLRVLEGSVAKVAGENDNRPRVSLRAVTTGTAVPDLICAAPARGSATGIAVGGMPHAGSQKPARIRVFNVLPGDTIAPLQLHTAVTAMIEDGLEVAASIAGGRGLDPASQAMDANLKRVLGRMAVPLVLDNSLPDLSLRRRRDREVETIAAAVIQGGQVFFGNKIDFIDEQAEGTARR